MVSLGEAAGVRTVALLTGMSTPLGRAVGNALEVRESVEVLAGGGPPDVVELTVALATEMLAACGLSGGKDPAEALRDGSAMDTWRRMIRAQVVIRCGCRWPRTGRTSSRRRPGGQAGRVRGRVAAWRLGAGRARKEESVQPGAGIELTRRSVIR
jgi:thymidine phosphorylase